ncbi:MAG TPA: CheR family methyltransferase [Burkholderiaceae bacterium]|nr:CheR family methyltransferase [Burkholderiaceae bacterium]
MGTINLTDAEFSQFQRFIHEAAGIDMSPSKKALVSGRLAKRLQHWGLESYGKYIELLRGGSASDEVQVAVDLLTTNETFFFREPKHFELLHKLAGESRAARQSFRVWSAASSTGEEAYSIAMVLADVLGMTAPWDVLGSDISTRVLQRAGTGHYPLDRARHIPVPYRKRFCLRGTGPQDGTLLVERTLRQRVKFMQVNLNAPLPHLGQFDVVFLRNVMIYFDMQTKRQVVARVLSTLRPGGHFCIGHSESLNDVCDTVALVAPSIYRKP